jgi:hypothetical protein
MIREAVITTLNSAGGAHVTPLGYRMIGARVSLEPFVPSQTLENLRRTGTAVLNFTDDVRIMAGALTGRREWPTFPSECVSVPRLADTLAHWEVEVCEVIEHPERPIFHCDRIFVANHRAFEGFNRAPAACVELAILVSRLDWLPPEKIEAELRYLEIAVDKTAGPKEREAWSWLTAAVKEHPRHRNKSGALTRPPSSSEQ